ncbi:MAG: ATP-dependent Clp protease ATP-binding subunit, partial [Saprospiraceae bacterium]|nr:ATP-dependent Clp protease ATP-binding subunit [Saprospiraceae bacterium]
MSNVQDIVSAIWYRHISWEREEVLYSFPTPDEVSYYITTTQNPWLPRLAQQILVKKPVLYGRAKELEQLVQAFQNPFQKNILLVGENGVGKSVLIYEAVRVLQEQNLLPEIWETTAARLIKELIQKTGWQDNIVFLCNELVQKKAILYVRNLMELFEVGQYEGNEVSLGLYLRSVLSQGEIALVAECTEDELAQIELKNSNYTTLFQIIRLNPPTDELQMIILQKSKDLANNKQISISEDAIKEIIRLNKRYTPYSGFPGKPIRFLENIISDAPKNTAILKSSIVRRFCEETGMPLAMVDETIPMDVAKVKAFFNINIFGQPQAVEGVVDILASVKAALMRKEKPIASFLFVGPTGVGKTELAKVLAEFMFGNRERMVRFDMSEYADDYSVARLIGTSVGSDGVLTSAIRREPFCVLLFDEIEKASSKFFDLLLPILGEGRLSDSNGKTVNFCATIIIMTSNIGVGSSSVIGLGEASHQSKSAQYLTAVQQYFRPELFNRFDEVIPFEALSKEVVRSVVNREIEQLKRREGVATRSMHLEITPAVLDYLAEKGYSIKYGARHLQRAIREELSIPLATKLNLEDYDDRLEV